MDHFTTAANAFCYCLPRYIELGIIGIDVKGFLALKNERGELGETDALGAHVFP